MTSVTKESGLIEQIEKLDKCPCGCTTHKRVINKAEVLELVEKDRKETAKKLVEIENALTTLFNDKSNVLSKSGLDTYSSILYPLIDLRKSLELIQVLEEEPSKVKQK